MPSSAEAADNGLAAIRPPGHHAMPDHGMGFCLLGNIAIAARFAQKQHGIERVLIVDYDVHHGNGTEAMFYDDPSVLFISTHQYPLYPGTGAVTDIGAGKGRRLSPSTCRCRRAAAMRNYATVFEQIVWRAAERFQPQLILVSAGFDAHWTDPLAGMRLTLTGYAHLTQRTDAHGGAVVRRQNRLCAGRRLRPRRARLRHEQHRAAAARRRADRSAGRSAAAAPEPDITTLIALLKKLHKL